MSKGDTDAFLKALFKREAGTKTRVINYAGYVGKYQFGESALIDLGYYEADGSGKNDWKGKWTGKNGITSLEDFRNSVVAQDTAAEEWIALLCKRMKQFKLDKFIGSTIKGIKITESGIIAGAHLKGFGSAKHPGVIQFLRSQGALDPQDGLKTSVSHYVELLGGYDLGCCGHMNLVFAEKETGAPIADLKVQVTRNGAPHKTTSTDTKGLISAIRGFSIGDRYGIWVARLTGGWKQLRSGTIQDSVHNVACLSPKSKACATTEVHKGPPGPPPAARQRPAVPKPPAPSAPAPQPPKPAPTPTALPKAGAAPAAASPALVPEVEPIAVTAEHIDQLDINSALWATLPHIAVSEGEEVVPGAAPPADTPAPPAAEASVEPTVSAAPANPAAPLQPSSAADTGQGTSDMLAGPANVGSAGSAASAQPAAAPPASAKPAAPQPAPGKPADALAVNVEMTRSASGHPKAVAIKKPPATPPPVPESGGKVITGLLFPLEERPKVSYKNGGRNFGANRPNGRKHAGIDLYAPVGTPVRAMADGKVLRIYQFYLGTYVIEIDHGTFIARYGEVKRTNILVHPEQQVKRGQFLGQVGKLKGLDFSMLHLEMFSSTKNPTVEDLTLRGVKPYQRRSDLMDPTASIDKAVME